MTYDGPDLDAVAGHWGCDVDEVVARHRAPAASRRSAASLPGFAYLSGLPDELAVPAARDAANPRAGRLGGAGG